MSGEEQDDVKAISTLISVLRPLDEDARVHVLEFVLKRLGISLTAGPSAPAHRPVANDLNSPSPAPATTVLSGDVDIRTFAAEKNPKTVNEKVAVIAYYLAHLAGGADRRDYIASDDIKPYFVQAGFPLPTAPPSMTLVHAKNAGYLNALDKGQYKLNAVGHNLVAHKLPSREAKDRKRKPTRKPAKKKARPKAKK